MRPAQIICSVFLCTTLSSAWPWPAGWKDLTPLEGIEVMLGKRQGNDNNNQPSSAPSGQGSAPSSTGGASSGGSSAPSATGGQSSGKSSGTASGTSSGGNSKGSSSAPPTSIDPRLGPGGVQMITPAPTAQSSYYKIGNHITFAWNYTSLSVTPSAIDILASCTANQETYTLATNTSVDPTATFIWDTGAWQANTTQSLLTETYTLIIHDAAKDVSATPQAGYLSAFNQFTFGMYLPQQYTPLGQYVCATCSNGGITSMERQTLGFLFGMATITVLSFTWFASNFGLF